MADDMLRLFWYEVCQVCPCSDQPTSWGENLMYVVYELEIYCTVATGPFRVGRMKLRSAVCLLLKPGHCVHGSQETGLERIWNTADNASKVLRTHARTHIRTPY